MTATNVAILLSRGRDVASRRADRFMLGSMAIYVHLWIVEGALRKWIPATATPLYVFRDAVLIACIALAFAMFGAPTRRVFATTIWLAGLALVTFVAIQVIASRMDIAVGLFGIRNYVAPILIAYVVWMRQLGGFLERAVRIIACWAPIQLIIVIVQVSSGVDSPINAQVGGESAYFTSAFGVVRASGTFSAPAGLIVHLTLALFAAIVMMSDSSRYSRLLAIVCFASAIGMLAISGSRGAIFSAATVAIGWLVYTLINSSTKAIRPLLIAIILGIAAYFAVAQLFPSVIEAFAARFENADQSEDTVARILGAMVGFANQPVTFLGDGAGSHSTIGISVGSPHKWVEDDSSRWVAELGYLGLMLSILRFAAGIALGGWAILKIRQVTLPTFLAAAAMVPVALGGSITTSPTSQGFFAIALGMLLSSRLPGDELMSATDLDKERAT